LWCSTLDFTGHWYHHVYKDVNFGAYTPFWDWLCGTSLRANSKRHHHYDSQPAER